MIFNYDANKTHFHKKGFAVSLVVNVTFLGTQKWLIGQIFVTRRPFWLKRLKKLCTASLVETIGCCRIGATSFQGRSPE